MKKRIGIIGYGQIGKSLHNLILENNQAGFEITAILERNDRAFENIPQGLGCRTISSFLKHDFDLVVEAAHPVVVQEDSPEILQKHDMMIMSVSALGDLNLEKELRETCAANGTKLYIPHGATLGLDGLRDGLSIWEEVSITMKKNPKNLNFDGAPHLKPDDNATEAVTLYDGPARGLLPLFPKNVNSHATLGLATVGLEKTRSILICDPGLDESVIEINAKGSGTSIHIERRNPIKGVTGKLTILSVMESIKNAFGENGFLSIC